MPVKSGTLRNLRDWFMRMRNESASSADEMYPSLRRFTEKMPERDAASLMLLDELDQDRYSELIRKYGVKPPRDMYRSSSNVMAEGRELHEATRNKPTDLVRWTATEPFGYASLLQEHPKPTSMHLIAEDDSLRAMLDLDDTYNGGDGESEWILPRGMYVENKTPIPLKNIDQDEAWQLSDALHDDPTLKKRLKILRGNLKMIP